MATVRTPDAVPPAFGDLLKRYRAAAGLTQEELAERARLSVRAIADLERGARRTPRKDTVHLLAAALSLSPDARALFEAAARPRATTSTLLPSASILGPAGGALPPLVGRAGELAVLEQHLAAEGSPSGPAPLLLLAGEPGIGKSRLLREATVRAPRRGWTVLEGGCQRRGGQEPYAPLLQALERHIARQSRAQQ